MGIDIGRQYHGGVEGDQKTLLPHRPWLILIIFPGLFALFHTAALLLLLELCGLPSSYPAQMCTCSGNCRSYSSTNTNCCHLLQLVLPILCISCTRSNLLCQYFPCSQIGNSSNRAARTLVEFFFYCILRTARSKIIHHCKIVFCLHPHSIIILAFGAHVPVLCANVAHLKLC